MKISRKMVVRIVEDFFSIIIAWSGAIATIFFLIGIVALILHC